MDQSVVHDVESKEFFIITEGNKAFLKYKVINKEILDYYSTFVPKELRGKGIAGLVTRAALEFAKTNHYYIIPSCPYVESYIAKHTEYQDLLSSF